MKTTVKIKKDDKEKIIKTIKDINDTEKEVKKMITNPPNPENSSGTIRWFNQIISLLKSVEKTSLF